MKKISKEELKKLYDNEYIFNTKRGVVNNRGKSVGFYRTSHKWYIEDHYADIVKSL